MSVPLSYIARNLWSRRVTTLLTATGLTLVVFVFATVMMMDEGLRRTLVTTGEADNVTIIRKGQAGDCMYFIASGEVEVELPGKKVRLGAGAFFGEMALLGNNLRSADITTTTISRLLILDLVDFRVLMARHPELVATIDAEARRRAAENK